MTGLEAISALRLDGGAPLIDRLGSVEAAPAARLQPGSFDTILSGSLDAVDDKLARADALVRQFAVDDSIPVHQVTLALEEARLSVELAMQVRARMVETYREFMTMQL